MTTKPILPKDEALNLPEYVRKLWEKRGNRTLEEFLDSQWVRGLCVSETMRAKVREIAEELARGEQG